MKDARCIFTFLIAACVIYCLFIEFVKWLLNHQPHITKGALPYALLGQVLVIFLISYLAKKIWNKF